MRLRGLDWTGVESWLLLLLTVLRVAGRSSDHTHRSSNGQQQHSSCPADPESSARDCLARYHSLFTGLGIENLYTGLDAEIIRHICSELMNAIICAHDLKELCPDTEHTDITLVMDDIVSMYELCSQRNIIEVYSRNQNCFVRQSATSEECYHKFRAATEESIMTQALIGDQTALSQLCNHVDTLIRCIRTRVEINCNQESAAMVSLLVKPSIRLSEHCRNETLYKTTTSTTTITQAVGVTPSVRHHDERWADNSPGSSSSSSSWLLLTLLVTCLMTSLVT